MVNELEINTVCYQGLPYSYSECAAKALFKGKKMVHKETFEDVFRDVYDNKADIGVVPIENSTAGYITEVYDLLLSYDLYINYGYIKKVDHCLAGTKDASISDIKEVYSHPQALMQCKEYIKNHGFTAKKEKNTAVAAKKVFDINLKSVACICSQEAADNYGLKVLECNINSKQNYTRFVAVSKVLLENDNHNRISIVFTIPHEAGTLNNVLSRFSDKNVSLCSIYSRPDLKSPWQYMFYLDFEANILNCEVKQILDNLKNELPFMKILGSFQIL